MNSNIQQQNAGKQENAVLCQSVHDINEIKEDIDKIAQEIIRITLLIKKKNIKDINKNFQATLTNYFLECQVCQLLTKPLKVQYKRDVRKIVENLLNGYLNSNVLVQQNDVLLPEDLKEKILQRLNNYHIHSGNSEQQTKELALLNQSSSQSESQSPSSPQQSTTKIQNTPQIQTPLTLSANQSAMSIEKIKGRNGRIEKVAISCNTKRQYSEISPQTRQTGLGNSQYIKKEKTAKYIMLIGIYTDFIECFDLSKEFVSTLINNIKTDSINKNYIKDSQKYITLYQKKLCSIIILQYYLRKEEQFTFKSFCDLWNSVFINHKLFYFARETNLFYNKMQIRDLIDGCQNNASGVIENKQNKLYNNCNQIQNLHHDYHHQEQQNSNFLLNNPQQQSLLVPSQLNAKIHKEEKRKRSVRYRQIQQKLATISLNNLSWTEQNFFLHDDIFHTVSQNQLKILPVQSTALNQRDEQLSEMKIEQDQKIKLINDCQIHACYVDSKQPYTLLRANALTNEEQTNVFDMLRFSSNKKLKNMEMDGQNNDSINKQFAQLNSVSYSNFCNISQKDNTFQTIINLSNNIEKNYKMATYKSIEQQNTNSNSALQKLQYFSQFYNIKAEQQFNSHCI